MRERVSGAGPKCAHCGWEASRARLRKHEGRCPGQLRCLLPKCAHHGSLEEIVRHLFEDHLPSIPADERSSFATVLTASLLEAAAAAKTGLEAAGLGPVTGADVLATDAPSTVPLGAELGVSSNVASPARGAPRDPTEAIAIKTEFEAFLDSVLNPAANHPGPSAPGGGPIPECFGDLNSLEVSTWLPGGPAEAAAVADSGSNGALGRPPMPPGPRPKRSSKAGKSLGALETYRAMLHAQGLSADSAEDIELAVGSLSGDAGLPALRLPSIASPSSSSSASDGGGSPACAPIFRPHHLTVADDRLTQEQLPGASSATPASQQATPMAQRAEPRTPGSAGKASVGPSDATQAASTASRGAAAADHALATPPEARDTTHPRARSPDAHTPDDSELDAIDGSRKRPRGSSDAKQSPESPPDETDHNKLIPPDVKEHLGMLCRALLKADNGYGVPPTVDLSGEQFGLASALAAFRRSASYMDDEDRFPMVATSMVVRAFQEHIMQVVAQPEPADAARRAFQLDTTWLLAHMDWNTCNGGSAEQPAPVRTTPPASGKLEPMTLMSGTDGPIAFLVRTIRRQLDSGAVQAGRPLPCPEEALVATQALWCTLAKQRNEYSVAAVVELWRLDGALDALLDLADARRVARVAHEKLTDDARVTRTALFCLAGAVGHGVPSSTTAAEKARRLEIANAVLAPALFKSTAEGDAAAAYVIVRAIAGLGRETQYRELVMTQFMSQQLERLRAAYKGDEKTPAQRIVLSEAVGIVDMMCWHGVPQAVDAAFWYCQSLWILYDGFLSSAAGAPDEPEYVRKVHVRAGNATKKIAEIAKIRSLDRDVACEALLGAKLPLGLVNALRRMVRGFEGTGACRSNVALEVELDKFKDTLEVLPKLATLRPRVTRHLAQSGAVRLLGEVLSLARSPESELHGMLPLPTVATMIDSADDYVKPLVLEDLVDAGIVAFVHELALLAVSANYAGRDRKVYNDGSVQRAALLASSMVTAPLSARVPAAERRDVPAKLIELGFVPVLVSLLDVCYSEDEILETAAEAMLLLMANLAWAASPLRDLELSAENVCFHGRRFAQATAANLRECFGGDLVKYSCRFQLMSSRGTMANATEALERAGLMLYDLCTMPELNSDAPKELRWVRGKAAPPNRLCAIIVHLVYYTHRGTLEDKPPPNAETFLLPKYKGGRVRDLAAALSKAH
ncbi:unnamed protein product [Pedinophyceae sp. YPF-701]|nr:unnamed protein product [Pedinophyceae sp. YPF-701]